MLTATGIIHQDDRLSFKYLALTHYRYSSVALISASNIGMTINCVDTSDDKLILVNIICHWTDTRTLVDRSDMKMCDGGVRNSLELLIQICQSVQIYQSLPSSVFCMLKIIIISSAPIFVGYKYVRHRLW